MNIREKINVSSHAGSTWNKPDILEKYSCTGILTRESWINDIYLTQTINHTSETFFKCTAIPEPLDGHTYLTLTGSSSYT
jgi:hypothetical protein